MTTINPFLGLFEVLSESKPWTVRQVADAFSASFTTHFLGIDRLEDQGLVKRVRRTQY